MNGVDQVYTDGSKSSFKDVEDFYEGRETSSSSSGLALYRADGNSFTGIHISGSGDMSNSYMTEMLALGLGARLACSRGLVVYSDCAAALGSLRRRQGKKVKTSPYWQLDMLLDLEDLVRSEKVRAHPERRVVKNPTVQDRGITAADLHAGSGKLADLVVSQEEVLRMMTAFTKISLVHLSSGVVAICNLTDARAEYDRRRYLAKRDAYRLEA